MPISEGRTGGPFSDRYVPIDSPTYRPPQLYNPGGGLPPQAGDYYYDTGPGGRVTRYEYTAPNPLALSPGGWVSADDYNPPTSGLGGGGADPALLAESIRSNMAREAESRRQRALDAAIGAVTAYLTGTQIADARRLNAFQESRALLPSLVPKEQEYFAGQEPGGVLETAALRFGIGGFRGAPIQHKEITPAIMATPPGPPQVGSEILDYIQQLGVLGNA